MKTNQLKEGDSVLILGTEYSGEIEESLWTSGGIFYKIVGTGFARWIEEEKLVLNERV